MSFVGASEAFAAEFEDIVALSACKFDLPEARKALESAKTDYEDFIQKYGDVLSDENLKKAKDSLASSEEALERIVDFCAKKLYKTE